MVSLRPKFSKGFRVLGFGCFGGVASEVIQGFLPCELEGLGPKIEDS